MDLATIDLREAEKPERVLAPGVVPRCRPRLSAYQQVLDGPSVPCIVFQRRRPGSRRLHRRISFRPAVRFFIQRHIARSLGSLTRAYQRRAALLDCDGIGTDEAAALKQVDVELGLIARYEQSLGWIPPLQGTGCRLHPRRLPRQLRPRQRASVPAEGGDALLPAGKIGPPAPARPARVLEGSRDRGQRGGRGGRGRRLAVLEGSGCGRLGGDDPGRRGDDGRAVHHAAPASDRVVQHEAPGLQPVPGSGAATAGGHQVRAQAEHVRVVRDGGPALS